MNKKILVGLVIALAACKDEKPVATVIQTEPVGRRTIIVAAEATGTVEPVNVVEVKSKASGQITRMTVETGSEVKRGDLLVQLDTRDVDQQWEQAKADRDAARSRFDVALDTRKRERSLFEQRVMTLAEFQQGLSDSANAHTAYVRAEANLNLAEQRRDDATVRAPIEGTVIEKTVSEGSVITSSTGSMGAGTTLLKMADLSTVRVRAHFNETDIANVQAGLEATVSVDAFPNAPFRGVVEKIEPTAVVQQSVTLFPVLISINNVERKLRPGMNGEVRVEIDQRDNVLAVASDAIRTTREAEFVAGLLNLNRDSVRKQVDAQIASLGTGGSTVVGQQTSRGDVDITAAAFQDPQQQPQQGRRGGGQQGPGGPAPTAAECKPIADAYAKSPRVKARLDSISASGRGANVDRQALMAASNAAYAELGVDAMLARRCNRVLNPQAGGPRGDGQRGGNAGGATSGGAAQQAQGGAPGGNTAGQGGRRGGGGFGGMGGRGGRGAGGDARTGLVFVKKAATYEPRVIRTGLASYDYTEVTGGLEEGEEVVLITSAQLQQQQQQQRDNARARQGGPLGQPGGGPGGGGGGRGPGGGGGGGGGGRGPGGN